LYLSIHHDSREYRDTLAPTIRLLEGWEKKYGVRVKRLDSFSSWTRRYLGYGAEMEPFSDGNPRLSWESCVAKGQMQLHMGKLWKCVPLAYLGIQDAHYGLPERWKPYLAYKPLDPGCSKKALRAFLRREDEPVCGMCPARPQKMDIPLPIPASYTV
jgi:hypothetical protein